MKIHNAKMKYCRKIKMANNVTPRKYFGIPPLFLCIKEGEDCRKRINLLKDSVSAKKTLMIVFRGGCRHSVRLYRTESPVDINQLSYDIFVGSESHSWIFSR